MHSASAPRNWRQDATVGRVNAQSAHSALEIDVSVTKFEERCTVTSISTKYRLGPTAEFTAPQHLYEDARYP